MQTNKFYSVNFRWIVLKLSRTDIYLKGEYHTWFSQEIFYFHQIHLLPNVLRIICNIALCCVLMLHI